MSPFLEQAKHNQLFHDKICECFEDRFFDWKITIVFYTAIHYLKALAYSKGINIGENHEQIESAVNPYIDNALMPIKPFAWKAYKAMKNYSRTARYDGITDFETFEELKKDDYKFCLENFETFKSYMKSQGIELDSSGAAAQAI